MQNIAAISDDLKNFSMEQLVEAMQTGSAPQYLVLSEITDRRKKQAMANRNPQNDVSVKDQVMRSVNAGGISALNARQAANALSPESMDRASAIGSMEPFAVNSIVSRETPQGYADGGVVREGRVTPWQDMQRDWRDILAMFGPRSYAPGQSPIPMQRPELSPIDAMAVAPGQPGEGAPLGIGRSALPSVPDRLLTGQRGGGAADWNEMTPRPDFPYMGPYDPSDMPVIDVSDRSEYAEGDTWVPPAPGEEELMAMPVVQDDGVRFRGVTGARPEARPGAIYDGMTLPEGITPEEAAELSRPQDQPSLLFDPSMPPSVWQGERPENPIGKIAETIIQNTTAPDYDFNQAAANPYGPLPDAPVRPDPDQVPSVPDVARATPTDGLSFGLPAAGDGVIGPRPELSFGEPVETAVPEGGQAPGSTEQNAGSPSLSGGGGGGVGGSPYGGVMSEYEAMLRNRMAEVEKGREQEKWLAIAKMGFDIMASNAPTLGMAVGEGGRGALEQWNAMNAAADQELWQLQEAMMGLKLKGAEAALRQRASASRGGSGGSGIAGLKPWGAEVGRVMTQVRWNLDEASGLRRRAYEILNPEAGDLGTVAPEATPEQRELARQMVARAEVLEAQAASLQEQYGTAAPGLNVADESEE